MVESHGAGERKAGDGERIKLFLGSITNSAHASARLADRLDEHFELFIDIDEIQAGMKFTETIQRAVEASDVVLPIIGSRWLDVSDGSGRRRLDDPNDWVVAEIREALERGTPVVPVLVDGARMPTTDELPIALATLPQWHAVRVDHESFRADVEQLVGAVTSAHRSQIPVAAPRASDDPDYRLALLAQHRGDWATAANHLERVLERLPGRPEVVDRLAEARAMIRLSDLAAAADEAAAQQDWPLAVALLEQVTDGRPADETAIRRLQEARTEVSIASLHSDQRARADEEQWAAVLRIDREIAALRPSAANAGGVADRARRALAAAEAAEVERAYAEAVAYLDEERWNEAVRMLRTVLGRSPNYADAARLLAEAQRQLLAARRAGPSGHPARRASPAQGLETRRPPVTNPRPTGGVGSV